MSFKLLYENTAAPQGDFLVDPNLVAEAGMIGVVSGTTTGSPTGLPYVTAAVSGSSGLIGIIDENKTTQFLATVNGEYIASGQTTTAHANLVSATFAVSSGLATSAPATSATTLSSATNGTVTGISGTGVLVNYSYIIPGKAGDDTTLGSGKCTIWLQPGEYATDVYETIDYNGNVITYVVNDQLYVSPNSKLTKIQSGTVGAGLVVIGRVTKSPSPANPFLNFYKTGPV